MPHNNKARRLETRAARLRLPVSSKPIFVRIGDGAGLGYRRNTAGGNWVVRVSDGKAGYQTKLIGPADDAGAAAGALDFWQAQERARRQAVEMRAGGAPLPDAAGANATPVAAPSTVAAIIDKYETELRIRRGDPDNVARLRKHIDPALAATPGRDLTEAGLREWRDNLAGRLAPATVNRTATCFKAALNLAATLDRQIDNQRRAWEVGLATIPDAEQSAHVTISAAKISELIAAAPSESAEFALYVETAAQTGARSSQLRRLTVADLHLQGPNQARLIMPTSRKGRGTNKVNHRPVPIFGGLGQRLAAAACGRDPTAPLLLKPSGKPWRKSDPYRPFARVARRCSLDPAISIYALRHTSITRQLLKGVPARIVAVNHDTSIAEIERTYSRHIGDHAEELVRAALGNDFEDPDFTAVRPLHPAVDLDLDLAGAQQLGG